MSQSLTLNVSEEVYRHLLRAAEQAGQLPEALAAQWLALFTRNLQDDPLEKFIGAFRSNCPDWADNHDRYIGQSQIETHE
ncbi:hypothetical protein [Candidatus Electronema sp. JM]|uniref:hypothetical protein n=1 Tax=Candidatus Electronema sp. JM TaxID=3401571 RepID=UPI003AA86201